MWLGFLLRQAIACVIEDAGCLQLVTHMLDCSCCEVTHALATNA
jgi:hypothetical protein